MNKKSVLLALWQKFTSHFCKSEKKDELMAYISEFSTSPMETKEGKEKDTSCKTKNLTENVESFLKTEYLRHLNLLKLKNVRAPYQKCLLKYFGHTIGKRKKLS